MDVLLDRQASLASSKLISTSYKGFCIYLGRNNAQLIGVLGPFMIESGKTRAETLVVVGLTVGFSAAFSVGLSVGLTVGLSVVGLTVGLSVVGLTAAFTTGISNISFFGSFNNFLV
jgi:hypothetical protein